jgi:hypothetical protein
MTKSSHRSDLWLEETQGFGHELLSFLLQVFAKNKVLPTRPRQVEKFSKLFSACGFRTSSSLSSQNRRPASLPGHKNKNSYNIAIFILRCGIYWTKFECFSKKIQMIKKDSVLRKQYFGDKDFAKPRLIIF